MSPTHDLNGSARLAYRVDEAARLLGLSEQTLYRKIQLGQIPARKWEGRIMVLRDDLERSLQALPHARRDSHHPSTRRLHVEDK